MTIHTFEVSAMLTNEDYYKIQKDLKEKNKSEWTSIKNGMKYWGLCDKGILINMYQIKKNGFYAYSISYRISARRVIDNNNFVGLFNTKNYDVLEEKVNELLKDKSSVLPKLKKCSLKRMDFCVNTKLENQEQVKAYIRTAKRGNVPSKLEIYKEYDKTSKRQKPTKDDFTVYASEYVAVSIYNKYMEMKKENKENKNVFSEKEIEKAKNIVRIEIRCMEGKIKALEEKYKIHSISDFMRYGNIIGEDIFPYYLSRIFGNGYICTLKEALQRVDLSDFKPEHKDLLKDFLSLANEKRSVIEAVSVFKSFMGKKKVKKLIWMLGEIETNYVTVTNSDVKLFNNGYIPTPLELYNEFIKL